MVSEGDPVKWSRFSLSYFTGRVNGENGNMQVVKVLNNSLVLAVNENGEEVILMGKGIGYKKSIGEKIVSSQIEKIFELKDKKLKRDMIRLAIDTKSIYFEIANQIIQYAIDKYEMKILDYLYLSLTDHISFCVKRVLDGVVISNYYVREMQRLNPKEFDVGCYAIQVIQDRTGVEIPKDEIGNIAFHFINGQVDHPFNELSLKMEKITRNILHIVKLHFHLVYNENDFAYSRFITHAQLLAQRIVSNQMIESSEKDVLVESVKNSCKEEFLCVERINMYLEKEFNITLTDQEQMYLTIHIHRILEKK